MNHERVKKNVTIQSSLFNEFSSFLGRSFSAQLATAHALACPLVSDFALYRFSSVPILANHRPRVTELRRDLHQGMSTYRPPMIDGYTQRNLLIHSVGFAAKAAKYI